MRTCLKCNAPLTETGWECPSCGWAPLHDAGVPQFSPELASGFPDYPPEAHQKRVQFEKNSFWFVCRNRIITSCIKQYFPRAHDFLEIGCGTGFVLNGLARQCPDLALFGAEAYPSALRYARERTPKAEFAQMNAYRLPFFEEFDLVGAFDLLEHLEHDAAALDQMYRVAKPGGGLILTVPQHPWMWSALDAKAGHKRRYTRYALKCRVEKAGFQVMFMSSFVALLLPLMVFSRWRINRKFKNDLHTIQSEVDLPKQVNAVFKMLSSCDAFLIRHNISIPFGGSLLCIARKGVAP